MKKINCKKASSYLIRDLKPKHKEVIVRRFGLKKEPETLQAIGHDHGITRERVRQIEAEALEIIRKKAEKYQDVFNYILETIDSFGGVKEEKELLSYLGKDESAVSFFLFLTDGIERKAADKDFYYFWYKKGSLGRAKQEITKIIKFFKKKEKPIRIEEIKVGLDKKVVESYIGISKRIQKTPDGKVGLDNWIEVNPRGTKDKAYLLFKKMGTPLHFAQVASLIKNSPYAQIGGNRSHPTTVHNELIKDSRFVLVGRGIYALKEWGYERGEVKDVIFNLLKKKGPLPKDEIFEGVLEKRFVQKNTIYLNLQDKNKFLRDEKGRYCVRRVEEA